MRQFTSFAIGLVFGFGLILTGMYSPDIIIAGLKIGAATFKINLYLTFSIALITTFVFFQMRHWIKKPLLNVCYDLPSQNKITRQLVLGALLFGMGWGISGICPGPNVVGLGMISWLFYWIHFAGIIVGYLLAHQLILKFFSKAA